MILYSKKLVGITKLLIPTHVLIQLAVTTIITTKAIVINQPNTGGVLNDSLIDYLSLAIIIFRVIGLIIAVIRL